MTDQEWAQLTRGVIVVDALLAATLDAIADSRLCALLGLGLALLFALVPLLSLP